MTKLLQIFLAGVMVIVPFAITVWVIATVGQWVGDWGYAILTLGLDPATVPVEEYTLRILGALVIILAILLVGLLTHVWVFRWVVGFFERLVQRVPGVKTVYESVRDLLKLFGRDTQHNMGRVVLYSPPNTQLQLLGILTTETPDGVADDPQGEMVALYLPMAFMIGGPVMYVPKSQVRELDMPVERALKLCATAQVGFERLRSGSEDAQTVRGSRELPGQDAADKT